MTDAVDFFHVIDSSRVEAYRSQRSSPARSELEARAIWNPDLGLDKAVAPQLSTIRPHSHMALPGQHHHHRQRSFQHTRKSTTFALSAAERNCARHSATAPHNSPDERECERSDVRRHCAEMKENLTGAYPAMITLH